jgi:electron transport complex protein RnfC
VIKLTEYLQNNGSIVTSIVIENDGTMALDDSICPPVINSREDLISAIYQSGIVGLGGAGFPTYVKLDVDPDKIEYLIINGAECEPYITSDSVTMLTRGKDMATALEALSRWLNIKNVIIGIENNKKEAIAAMHELAASANGYTLRVESLPSVYPQGGEKVLVYHTTGRKIPANKLPIDVGCIVLNCTTLAKLMEFLKTGMPLVSKTVTVDGSAIKEPKNVVCPIGTPIGEVIEYCGGCSKEPRKVLYGGPMMGITVPDLSYPILKNTNAITVLAEDAVLPEPTECIRCGKCADACPLSLTPYAIASAVKHKDAEALSELSVGLCMECGCCSYICPAHKPLVQQNRLGKSILKNAASKGGK